MKKFLIICFFVLAAFYVNAQDKVIIAGDNVCLRFSPNESSKWTGSSAPHLYTGNMLTCVGQTGNYYKVIYNGDYYYVPKRYARPRGTSSSRSSRSSVTYTNYNYIIIAGDNVCFRSQPNESSKLKGSRYKHVNTGDILYCIGTIGNYYKVQYGGYYYYIPKKYGRPRY